MAAEQLLLRAGLHTSQVGLNTNNYFGSLQVACVGVDLHLGLLWCIVICVTCLLLSCTKIAPEHLLTPVYLPHLADAYTIFLHK